LKSCSRVIASATPNESTGGSERSDRVSVHQNGVASGDTGKDDDVTKEKMPAPQRAGTGNDNTERDFMMLVLELADRDPARLSEIASELLASLSSSDKSNETG
jgi:hypothetical protein